MTEKPHALLETLRYAQGDILRQKHLEFGGRRVPTFAAGGFLVGKPQVLPGDQLFL